MCCFPRFNNIGFQPQILKKAGVSLHPASTPFTVWLCTGADRVSEQANYLKGVFFSRGVPK
jgi:hypothetical protein